MVTGCALCGVHGSFPGWQAQGVAPWQARYVAFLRFPVHHPSTSSQKDATGRDTISYLNVIGQNRVYIHFH